MTTTIDAVLAKKVLEVVDCGLTNGLGVPVPGSMCIEAAVCFAMGLPHSDKPPCVGEVVRRFKISLNDSEWSSNAARAKGMRRLAVAQLGSTTIEAIEFAKHLTRLIIQRVVPMALRAAAKVHSDPAYSQSLNDHAEKCEKSEGDAAASDASAASAAAWDAARAARASIAASAAACAAAKGSSAAACAAASAAAWYAASDASAARAAARAAASAAARDEILSIAAECGVDALELCNSPGCQLLYLCDEQAARSH